LSKVVWSTPLLSPAKARTGAADSSAQAAAQASSERVKVMEGWSPRSASAAALSTIWRGLSNRLGQGAN
jgi:hypothetical protein